MGMERVKERANELEPARQRAFAIWKEQPEIRAGKLRELLEKEFTVSLGKSTIDGWLAKWRKGRGYARSLGAVKKVEPVEAETAVPPRVEAVPVTPESVADALLARVVDALKNHERLLAEVEELKGYRARCLELEKQLKAETEEKERILRIHNNQVRRRELTDVETLIRLAKLGGQFEGP